MIVFRYAEGLSSTGFSEVIYAFRKRFGICRGIKMDQKTDTKMDIAAAINQFGCVVTPFKGVSMQPLLVQGRDSAMLVRPKGRLKLYDVALFRRKNGEYVLHRVIKVMDDAYYIRGDNCLKSEFVRDDQIIAVAEGFYIKGTYHSCEEPKIARYAQLQKLTHPFRMLKNYCRAAIRRIKKIFGLTK